MLRTPYFRSLRWMSAKIRFPLVIWRKFWVAVKIPHFQNFSSLNKVYSNLTKVAHQQSEKKILNLTRKPCMMTLNRFCMSTSPDARQNLASNSPSSQHIRRNEKKRDFRLGKSTVGNIANFNRRKFVRRHKLQTANMYFFPFLALKGAWGWTTVVWWRFKLVFDVSF